MRDDGVKEEEVLGADGRGLGDGIGEGQGEGVVVANLMSLGVMRDVAMEGERVLCFVTIEVNKVNVGVVKVTFAGKL